MARPLWRQQAVPAHQPSHAVTAHPMALLAQARPHRTGALAMNGVAASTARMAATSVSSDAGVFGPRLAPDDAGAAVVRAAAVYAVDRGTR